VWDSLRSWHGIKVRLIDFKVFVASIELAEVVPSGML
jgi:hypothetical protein